MYGKTRQQTTALASRKRQAEAAQREEIARRVVGNPTGEGLDDPRDRKPRTIRHGQTRRPAQEPKRYAKRSNHGAVPPGGRSVENAPTLAAAAARRLAEDLAMLDALIRAEERALARANAEPSGYEADRARRRLDRALAERERFAGR